MFFIYKYINFIKWFCGYDVINKQKTPNSYQETSGVTVLAQCSYVSSLGKTETFQTFFFFLSDSNDYF